MISTPLRKRFLHQAVRRVMTSKQGWQLLGEREQAARWFWCAPFKRVSFHSHSPVQDLIQGFVRVFITFDPLHEIFHRLLCVAIRVVGAAQLHLLSRSTHKRNDERKRCSLARAFGASCHLELQIRVLTTIFSWITSGSSHTDSTKNT